MLAEKISAGSPSTARAARSEAAPDSGPDRPRRRRSMQPQGYTWILGAMVLSVGLLYYCIGYTGYISTLDWDGTDPVQTPVGADNYVQLFSDPVFWLTIVHALVFFAVTFTVQTTLGLVLASLLHSRVHLKTLYKVVIFTPVLLAPAIMAPVFRRIFAADGQLNAILRAVGLDGLAHQWLADSHTALPVIMAIAIWHSTGLSFILFYAALGQIDPEVLEAARIDGAGNVRMFVSIILPSVRGTTVALAMLTAIGSLKIFDIPYLVTVGGPNHATEFLGTYIYRESIPLANVGYGAALSIMLLVLAIGMALVLSVRRGRNA